MNRIAFRRVGSVTDDSALGEVRVLIDGVDLIELVRTVEASTERYASIAGQYAGLPPMWVCLPSRHFFGEPTSPLYVYGARTQVLECPCGEAGCYPLVCRIKVDGGTVEWSDFGFDHRDGEEGDSPYGQLGPYHFATDQYEQALIALGAAG